MSNLTKDDIDPIFVPPGHEAILFRTEEEFREMVEGRELYASEDGRRIFQPFDIGGSPLKEFIGYVVFVKVNR